MRRGQRKVINDLVPGAELPRGGLVRMPRQIGLAVYARAAGGKHGLIELARLSQGPRVQEFVALWDSLSAREQHRTPIEALLEKVDLGPREFLGELVKTAYDHYVDVSGLILVIAQPRLTQRLIQLAMKPEGAKYMEMALRAAGRFPMPEGHVLPFMRIAAVEKPIPDPPSVPGLPSVEEDAILDAEFQRVAEKRG